MWSLVSQINYQDCSGIVKITSEWYWKSLKAETSTLLSLMCFERCWKREKYDYNDIFWQTERLILKTISFQCQACGTSWRHLVKRVLFPVNARVVSPIFSKFFFEENIMLPLWLLFLWGKLLLPKWTFKNKFCMISVACCFTVTDRYQWQVYQTLSCYFPAVCL